MRKAVLLFSATILAAGFALPAPAAEEPSKVEQGKQGVKDVARAVGQGVKKATTAIGHGTRDAVKAIGHGTREAVHGAGDATRDAVK